jgi:hypothetical protein
MQRVRDSRLNAAAVAKRAAGGGGPAFWLQLTACALLVTAAAWR